MSQHPDLLVLSDITVTYPDGPGTRTVLDAADLSISAGELVVVSGASGSGKTTLLTIAGLLRRPDSGTIRVAGIETSELSNRKRTTVRREHVAIVFQSANLLPSLTAVEQLELVGHIAGEPRRDVRDRALQLLDQLDLSDRAGQRPHELSGGERQRVGIARALMSEPSVLIADEPTASLDPERAATVARLLSEATERLGAATLVVAHDDAALAHAHRHLHLADGTLTERALTS